MPIYEYHCPSCGHHMEALQNMSEAPLTHCPECGKETLEKKVSAAGFKLKGTGWYETDFKDKKAVTQPKQEKTDSAVDTATDTAPKPEAPAKTKKEVE